MTFNAVQHLQVFFSEQHTKRNLKCLKSDLKNRSLCLLCHFYFGLCRKSGTSVPEDCPSTVSHYQKTKRRYLVVMQTKSSS